MPTIPLHARSDFDKESACIAPSVQMVALHYRVERRAIIFRSGDC